MRLIDDDGVLNIPGIVGLVIIGLFGLLCVGWGMGAAGRVYDVWAERKAGEAELARAESNRQIRTLEAKAKLEGAKYLADAEIVRAEGVARANQIIADSLRGNEAYLRYLWIQNLGEGANQVIYVPTESNLPILEANRLTR